eukprot:768280-Hanusia_phi.AAC.5
MAKSREATKRLGRGGNGLQTGGGTRIESGGSLKGRKGGTRAGQLDRGGILTNEGGGGLRGRNSSTILGRRRGAFKPRKMGREGLGGDKGSPSYEKGSGLWVGSSETGENAKLWRPREEQWGRRGREERRIT